MQFSDSANNAGVIEYTDFLAGTNSTTYSTARKTTSINAWYRKVLSHIWKVQGYWPFDDPNLTDLPYFRTNLQLNQDDYALPANFGVVERIETKDSAGIWHRLTRRMRADIYALEEHQKVSNIPNEYELFSDKYRLYPASDRTSTDGDSLRVYCTRDIDAFTAADTTQEPGFSRNFHHILALGAAYDYAVAERQTQKANQHRQEIEQLMREIEQYYAHRAVEQQKPVRRERYW